MQKLNIFLAVLIHTSLSAQVIPHSVPSAPDLWEMSVQQSKRLTATGEAETLSTSLCVHYGGIWVTFYESGNILVSGEGFTYVVKDTCAEVYRSIYAVFSDNGKQMSEMRSKIRFYERYFGTLNGANEECSEFVPVKNPPVMPKCKKPK
jgi:hypothetical protein